MPGETRPSDRPWPEKWIRVRYGHRIYRAKRFKTGSWWIEDENGAHFMTLNHNDFQAQFENVPEGK